LVVSGDFEEDLTINEAKKVFSILKNKTKIKKDHKKEPKQLGAKRAVLNYDTLNDIVAIAYKIPPIKHKDTIGLEILSRILSFGNNSRLEKNIVDKKTLATSLNTFNFSLDDEGLFVIVGVCANGVKAEDLESEILKEVDKIKQNITQKELEKVKANIKFDLTTSFYDSSNVSEIFGSYLIADNLDGLLNYGQDLEKCTTTSLKKIANKYFQKNSSTTIIMHKETK